jgi:hypothetical protein
MLRKATYKLRVTRREALYVHDESDHTLMLVELEGEPIEYTPGVAGEFISRRSVNFHDRIKGSGSMQGYAMTHFQYGSVYSHYEGAAMGAPKSPRALGRPSEEQVSWPALRERVHSRSQLEKLQMSSSSTWRVSMSSD